jgi:hypothetical protein
MVEARCRPVALVLVLRLAIQSRTTVGWLLLVAEQHFAVGGGSMVGDASGSEAEPADRKRFAARATRMGK